MLRYLAAKNSNENFTRLLDALEVLYRLNERHNMKGPRVHV